MAGVAYEYTVYNALEMVMLVMLKTRHLPFRILRPQPNPNTTSTAIITNPK